MHTIATDTQWTEQRRKLLEREKELTRLHDEVARERRALPWRRITKEYVFDTQAGRRTLHDLFGGQRQLVLQHFMFGPGWEQGCPSCSFMADHMDGMTIHLAHRDIAFVAVSRAPLADILRFRERMGWSFDWVSSQGSDFNFDFHVSFTQEELATGEVQYNYRKGYFPAEEAPGISVFCKDDAGQVFHTYSTFGRGVEAMMGSYVLMDLTPQGRNERDTFYKMEWVRHHDRYEPGRTFEPAPEKAASCPHCES
jgi:predicted dithiol-disulfide oxidoreductase (DUF899 family)